MDSWSLVSLSLPLFLWAVTQYGQSGSQPVSVSQSDSDYGEPHWPIEGGAVAWQCRPRIAHRNDGKPTWPAHLFSKVAGPNARPCHQLVIIIARRSTTTGRLLRSENTTSCPIAISTGPFLHHRELKVNSTREEKQKPRTKLIITTLFCHGYDDLNDSYKKKDCIRGCAGRFNKSWYELV